jgi:hypothetical protein
MRKLAWMLPAAALAFAGVARADDKDVKTDEKHEVKKNHDGSIKAQHHSKTKKHGHTKSEMKVDSDSRAKMGGGSVSTTTTTKDVDRPGVSKDAKSTVKETTEKDAHGDVTKHEVEKK